MPALKGRGEVMPVVSRIAVAAAALSLAACAYGEKSFAVFAAKHPDAHLQPVEFVKQKEAADCGAAALTSVGKFWGADVAPGSIFREWAPANRAFGYSIAELYDVSGRLGLSSSRLLEQPDEVFHLVDEGVPVIAPIAKPYQREDVFDWMLSSMLSRLVVSAFVDKATVNHYVVVVGSDDRFVYLLDPQDGYRVAARSDFVEQWSDLTHKFLPDAGQSVAALAPYRAPPESAGAP
jgi:ABC-type bacteriocin/lantibiotic exporter with double-glycine peptidase domain